MALSYGAADHSDQERATRISFLIDTEGKIAQIYEAPDPTHHPGQALEDLGQVDGSR
jgi:peroxiredoxin